MQAFEAVVVLARQAFDVAAQRLHMLLERGLVIASDELLVGGEADLGIHHYLLVAGQHDQHIRLEALAIGALEADLGLVFAALFQAGMLQYPFEDQLTPVALGFLALQRLGQVGGFVGQAQVELLQALQLLAQREALAGFLLVAFLHTFFEGLDALLERVEQLAEMLLAGLGEALLALVEDLGSHVGELGAQGVAGFLQVFQALLVAFLLLAQFGVQTCGLGLQAAQFGFAVGTLEVPGVGGVTGVVAVDLQQFQLTPLGGQLGLLDGVGFTEVADLVAAGIQLRLQAGQGQLGSIEALFEQGLLALPRTLAALHLHDPTQAG
ncbi:hypothetical protein D3C80_1214100 [compost metagenome]